MDGLQFGPSKLHRFMQARLAIGLDVSASVFVAAVLESVAAEILTIGGHAGMLPVLHRFVIEFVAFVNVFLQRDSIAECMCKPIMCGTPSPTTVNWTAC